MRVYHDFFLVPGSRSTFPDADPDPGQWYGSDRIRNTDLNATINIKTEFKEDMGLAQKHEMNYATRRWRQMWYPSLKENSKEGSRA